MSGEAATRRIWIERRTWPDRPQSRAHGYLLGRDEHGTWIGLPAGHPVYRGDTLLYTGTHPVVLCVPEGDWWAATWFGRTVELFIDVVAPARWTDGTVVLVDLDLGIMIKDGTARLVDAERFEEHRLLYEYPSSVEASARAAASQVLDAATAGLAPFTPETGAGWFTVLRAAIDGAANGGATAG